MKRRRSRSQPRKSDHEVELGTGHLVFHIIMLATALIAAGVAVVSFVVGRASAPPSSEPILRIIDAEASAALQRDVDRAVALFADDAFVRDWLGESGKRAGNVPQDVPTSWSGMKEIRSRYESLPKFVSLRHLGIVVTFDDTKKFARATGSTNSVFIDPIKGTPTTISSIEGERWTFEKVGGVWKITSFTYNIQ